MKAMIRGVIAICTIAAALCGVVHAQATTFTVTIVNDGFAQFLPMSNQFWDKWKNEKVSAKYYGGFLVQLATVKNANHIFSHVELTKSDGTTVTLKRSEVEWLDVVCDTGTERPISPPLARLLFPDKKWVRRNRVVHRSIERDSVSVLTLWRADYPMSVESSKSVDHSADHGHDQYVFSSPVACRLDVWKDLDGVVTTEYDLGEIAAMKIYAGGGGADHGGLHQPWWFTK